MTMNPMDLLAALQARWRTAAMIGGMGLFKLWERRAVADSADVEVA